MTAARYIFGRGGREPLAELRAQWEREARERGDDEAWRERSAAEAPDELHQDPDWGDQPYGGAR